MGTSAQAYELANLMEKVAPLTKLGRLPDNYIVFDCETTGVRPESANAVQWGVCWVANRRMTSSMSQIVALRPDIYMHPQAEAVHGITKARMAREGLPQEEVVCAMAQVFEQAREQGFMFLGHNAVKFDCPIFMREAHSYGLDFMFEPDEIIDTGMLFKAIQLDESPQGETLGQFYERIAAIRARGVRWALSYCLEQLQITPKVPTEKLHDAEADCIVSHQVFETLRELQ